jgi:hypothetical protein
LKFLSFDPWAAARRIVDYWSVRVELFGTRAFLPLLLTGEGALSEEDLQVLRTGSYMLLPCTANHVPVLLYDPARLTTTVVTDTAKRLRCLFYFLSAVSETDSSLVSLSLYNTRTRKATFDLKLISDSISYFGTRQVIPVRIVEAHMIMITKGFESAISLTLREMQKLGAHNPCRVFVYDPKPMEQIQAEMKKRGFTLEGLPRVPFEGLFSFGCFRRWMAERNRKTIQLYDSKPSSLERPEEDEARKRRQNEAANARRKRARKKIEEDVLRSEIDRLVQQRKDFQKTRAELTSRIEDARLVVRLFTNQGLLQGVVTTTPDVGGSRLTILGSREFTPEVFPESRLASSRESPAAKTKEKATPGTSAGEVDNLSSPPCFDQQATLYPSSLSLLPQSQPLTPGGSVNPSIFNAPIDPVALLFSFVGHRAANLPPMQSQPSQVEPQLSRLQESALPLPANLQPSTLQPANTTNQLALLQGLIALLTASRQS